MISLITLCECVCVCLFVRGGKLGKVRDKVWVVDKSRWFNKKWIQFQWQSAYNNDAREKKAEKNKNKPIE